MAVKVKREGRGLDDLIRRLKDEAVEVGIHKDGGAYPDGTSVAQIGAYNEYGTSKIPERSFIRSTLNENRNKYIGIIGNIAASDDIHQGFGRLGRLVEGDIKKKIVAIKEPPNAESTIARKKGADNPLVDTGQLVNSIRWKYAKPDRL